MRATGSRIVFTYGDLDPWATGGLTPADVVGANGTVLRDMVVVNMRGAAHHLDLRAPNVLDPPDVVEGRALQKKYVEEWVRLGHQGDQCVRQGT